MKFKSQLLPVFLWMLGAAVFLKLMAFRIYDPDLWWHLATGRWMVEHHQFLRTDLFSHTLLGTPWTNFEWLSQIVLYLAVKSGGLYMLWTVRIIIAIATMGLMAFLARREGARGAALLVLTWLAFKILQFRLQDRPELFSLLLMVLLVTMISSILSHQGKRRGYFVLFCFALQVLWVNLHGGFIFGLGFLFLCWVGSIWEKETREIQGTLFWCLIASSAGALVNPSGIKLAWVFIEHSRQMKFESSLIEEWKPLGVYENPYFWVLYFLSAVFFAIGIIKKWPRVRLWAPAFVIFAIWGTLYRRNAALFVFAAIPFLSNGFSRMKWSRREHWGGLALFVGMLSLETSSLLKPWPHEPVAWNFFPAQACRFVQENNIEGNMYNAYDAGGYIEWALGPSRKTFLDGRYLFYRYLEDYIDLFEVIKETGAEKNPWPSYLNSHQINYAIVKDKESSLTLLNSNIPFSFSPFNFMFPRSDWALVFWDDAGLVFVKRTVKNKVVINKFEDTALWPYNLDQMRHLLKEKKISVQQAQGELQRHKERVGFTVVGNELEKLLSNAKKGIL